MILPLSLLVAALHLSQAAVLQTPPKGFIESNPDVSIHSDAFFATFNSPAGSPKAQSDQEAFRAQMKRLGIQYKERHHFSTLINAVSFEMDVDNLDKVTSIDVIKDVFPMVSRKPPKTIVKQGINPKLRFAHGLTGVKAVHETLGFTGKGVKVGVLDTGIDYKHPALGGCFGEGCRVAYGHDFVGDAYTGANEPQPDDDPRDCNDGKGGGHGTHVAGIVGAKDKDFVGVAPEVTLGAYRIFGCEGSTSTDIIIAAMERGYKDGMDVLNLSLGGGSSWPSYPDALVADELAKRGVIVLGAMGNDGARGLFMSESPGIASRGFGVASFDNLKFMGYGFKIDGQDESLVYSNSDEKIALDYKNAEVASALSEGSDLACVPLKDVDLTGKIALVRRGDCLFKDKALNAEKAGAKAVLLYNKEFGIVSPGYDKEPNGPTIPIVGTTQAVGLNILELLKKGKVTVSFFTEKQAFDTPTGGKVSDFSSWGPGPQMEMKPDIGAPGGLILSTMPLALGGYGTMSGTSMATPYAAGSMALFIQAKGKKDPAEVRDVFKNTAKPAKNWSGNEVAPVFRQGAGLINVKDALTTTTFVRPSTLPLNSTDINGSTLERTISIVNTAKTAMIYTFEHKPSSAVQPWDKESGEIAAIPAYKTASAKVSFSAKSVRVAAGATRDVKVTISAPSELALSERWLYSGYLVVQPVRRGDKVGKVAEIGDGIDWNAVEKQTEIYVPYSGMHGEYRKISILAKPSTGFPALTLANKTVITANQTSATFSLKETDVPTVNVRLVHPCRKLLVKVLDASNNRELGLIEGGENLWLGQNGHEEADMSYALSWNGNYVPDVTAATESELPTTDPKTKAEPKQIENGKYKLRILAQRPYNSGNTRRGFEQWDSPAFSIDRNATVPPPKDTEDINPSRRGNTLTRLTDAIKKQGAAERQKAEQLAQDSVLPKQLVIPVTLQ